MKRCFTKVGRLQKGATLVEYALALTLVVIVSVGSIIFLADATKERAEKAREPLKNVAPCLGVVSSCF
jgi:Flp pilus assembly pilin Flp